MKTKGFTLVELLAVIIIIGLIALIASPLILNEINAAEKNTILTSGDGLIKASKTYFTTVLSYDLSIGNQSFEFPDNHSGLNLSGEIPTGGYVAITTTGDIEIRAVYRNKYCVKKDMDEDKVSIHDKDEC